MKLNEIKLSDGDPKRVILHWTAGVNHASAIDLEHYHYIIERDQNIVPGRYTIADNDRVNDGRYAAHTLNCNTRSVGIAVAGMRNGLKTRYPISLPQVDTAAQLIAAICQHYQIRVSPQTVLTHSEVADNLQIPQRGKIDIDWIPHSGYTTRAAVGQYLRRQVEQYIQGQLSSEEVPPSAFLLLDGKQSLACLQDGTTLFNIESFREVHGDKYDEVIATLPTLNDSERAVTYASARQLAIALGFRIRWNAETRQAVIK